MHYLANTSFIKTQTVTDTSPASRVGSAHPSHRWMPGTSLGDASRCSDTMKETYTHSAGIATGLAFTDEENSTFFQRLSTVSSQEELRTLCEERTKVEQLRRNILNISEMNSSCIGKSWSKDRSWSSDKVQTIVALSTARRALLRIDYDLFQSYNGSHLLARLNHELHMLTGHSGYKAHNAYNT